MCFWQQFFVLPIEVKSVNDLFVDFGKEDFNKHNTGLFWLWPWTKYLPTERTFNNKQFIYLKWNLIKCKYDFDLILPTKINGDYFTKLMSLFWKVV